MNTETKDDLELIQKLLRELQTKMQSQISALFPGAAVAILIGIPIPEHDTRAIMFATPFDTENLARFLDDAKHSVDQAVAEGQAFGFVTSTKKSPV